VQELTRGSQSDKGTNYVPKAPHQLQDAYQRRKRKSESVLSLEEASLATT
jgi:hypothetical protein